MSEIVRRDGITDQRLSDWWRQELAADHLTAGHIPTFDVVLAELGSTPHGWVELSKQTKSLEIAAPEFDGWNEHFVPFNKLDQMLPLVGGVLLEDARTGGKPPFVWKDDVDLAQRLPGLRPAAVVTWERFQPFAAGWEPSSPLHSLIKRTRGMPYPEVAVIPSNVRGSSYRIEPHAFVARNLGQVSVVLAATIFRHGERRPRLNWIPHG